MLNKFLNYVFSSYFRLLFHQTWTHIILNMNIKLCILFIYLLLNKSYIQFSFHKWINSKKLIHLFLSTCNSWFCFSSDFFSFCFEFFSCFSITCSFSQSFNLFNFFYIKAHKIMITLLSLYLGSYFLRESKLS